MKLSDAILLGSTMSEQAFGALVVSGGKTCALGSALLATGKMTLEGSGISDYSDWPWLKNVDNSEIACPHRGCRKISFSAKLSIAHLNDDHRWTRERIASWVATIEPQEEPTLESCESAADQDKAEVV